MIRKNDYREEIKRIKFLMEYKINDYLINEGRNADKAIQNTYAVIKNFFNNAGWLNNTYDSPTLNPNNLSILQYIEHAFRTDYFGTNVSDSVIRLEPIMMNIALSLGFEQNNSDGEKLKRLQDIITYIKINNKKEGFPIQLNKLTIDNTSFETLNNIFGKVLDDELEKDNELANQNDNTQINPNYEILEINSQNEAKKYGQYSCHNSILCYTTHKEKWEEFTGKGRNKVYLILNKDWKNIPEEYGENNPYDEYGLSMIFLFINPYGNIAFSNTRWNHGTRERVTNVDHSFNKSQISKLLGGINFNSLFKPYSEKELIEKGFKTIEMTKKMLEKGFPLEEIFDKVDRLDNGFSRVELNYKYSLVNDKGQLIGNGNQWFDDVGGFFGGFSRVNLNGKYSLIDTNGQLIGNGNLWFEHMGYFHRGYAIVGLNNKYSFINTKGNLIGNGNAWFDDVENFYDDFAVVQSNDKYSFINTNGQLIGNGKLWFDDIYNFRDGMAKVGLNNKWTYIDRNGNYIKDNMWFDQVRSFSEGLAIVQSNGKYSFINTKGNLIGNGKLWFDDADKFSEGFATVKLHNKWSYIDRNGNYIKDNMWFDEAYNFSQGFAIIRLNGKYSYINSNGQLIANGKLWFNDANNFNQNNIAFVNLNGEPYIIDKEGNFYDYDNQEPIPNPLA